MMLDDSILSAKANPSWPVPFPGNPQPGEAIHGTVEMVF